MGERSLGLVLIDSTLSYRSGVEVVFMRGYRGIDATRYQ